jgi:uncharacterized repeat protein (TIGR01451 family)
MRHNSHTRFGPACFLAACLVVLGWATPSWAALTITPITWNVIGLDSNSPATGPFQFPVGARVCAIGAPSVGAVTASFAFQPFIAHAGVGNGDNSCAGSAPCVTLRTGSLISYSIGALTTGQCQDAYFEVEVKKEVAAFGTGRLYTISAVDTGSDPAVSTPQPRELFVERLISQNRNSVQDVSYSAALNIGDPFPTPVGPGLTSISAGGSFGLAVGGIYDIRLDASTATQGYEQLETFANFSNAVFRILRVQSTYSANTSPLINGGAVPATTDLLYANGCNWQLSPVLPNYLGCQATGKAGGTISATYRIQVLTVPGGTSSALNTLVYDYSGSSFHYNADTGVGGRTIVIVNPLDATFSKSFTPSSIAAGGVSQLRFTIANPNISAVSGYNFTDNLPAGLVVASPPNASTSGCGTPSFAPAAGATSLSFGNPTRASIAAYSSCTVSVDVTGAADGTYVNGSSTVSGNPNAVELFVDASPTAQFATATLTIGPPPTPGTCNPGQPMVDWSFTGQTVGATPTHSLPVTTVNPLVTTGTAFIPRTVGFTGVNTIGAGPSLQGTGWSQALSDPGATMLGDGSVSYYEFQVASTAYQDVAIAFDASPLGTGDWANPSNNGVRVYVSFNGGTSWADAGGVSLINRGAVTNVSRTTTGSASNLRFRITIGGANKNAAEFRLDNVAVTGCRIISYPTVAKSFSVPTIGIGQTSLLTLTLTNPNTSALTGVAISDPMPAGLSINASPAPTNTCGGTFSAPAGAGQTISLSGGTLAASSSCTITASVTGTTSGLKTNTTGAISSTETGSNPNPGGSGTAQIRVIAPPTIAKSFTNSPIVTGGNSGLNFTITNPNAGYSMVNIGFSDTFPVAPGAMVVATPPSATNGCGGTWTTTAGAGSVSLSGVTLGPSGSCSVSVQVTAPAAGTYNNTSGAVSHVINSATLNGNTAAASLVANAPVPRVGLQKRISLSPSGPWGEFVSLPPSGQVYYQFTIENTGDTILNRPASGFWITDALIPGGPFCGAVASLTLPTVSDSHIYECVVGPITASASVTTVLNTATATGTPPSGPDVTATNTAAYTTKLPDLDVSKSRILPAGPVDLTPGFANITYRITVFNKNPSATVNDTLSPIVVEDTLRSGITYLSFTSGSPFWSCSLVQTSPLHKVSCTYSAQLAAGATTTFDLNVRVVQGTPDVNNTAIALGGGDPACNDPNPTPASECKGPYFEGTVPVTLSDVSVTVDAGILVVDFGTAAEAGTLGFRVLGNRAGDRQRLPISDALVVASGSDFKPRRYQVRGPYTGQTEVWIEEVTTVGGTESYGPFAIGSNTGERDLFTPTNWSAIAAEQSSFRQTQAAAVLARGSGSSVEAELRVAQTGLVRVSHEQLLAQGVDWSGTPANQIRMSHGSAAVPMRYEGPANFGAGSALYFFGQAIEQSQYTRTAAYRLSVNSSGANLLRTIHAGAGRNATQGRVRDSFVHNPNRAYDLTSAHTDPWYAQRIVRVNAPLAGVNEAFVVPDVASSTNEGVERIQVGVWGGINFPQSPDHSVRLLLNGTQIATRSFDGLSYELISVDLPQGVLRNGSNTLRVELVGDTGLYADVVFLDSIRIDYVRELKAIDNRLAFTADIRVTPDRAVSGDQIYADDFSTEGVAACSETESVCGSYRVRGLTRADVDVYRAGIDGSVEQLSGARIEAVAGGYELAFSARQLAGDRFWIEPATGSVTSAIAAKTAVTDPLAGGPGEFLIVSHPSFINGLAPLVAARQAEGFTVRVVDVETLYAYYNRGTVDPVAIGTAIADAYERLGTRYVLLVGGDTYDYFNYTGANSISFLPTNYRATGSVVRFAPVDSPFADVDGDGRSDVAIGRFPVRTAAQLSALVAKTLAYPQAAHAGKHLRVADRSNSTGVDYADQLTSLNGLFGAGTVTTNLSLNNYPAGNSGVVQARADLVTAVNAGQSMVTFFGHSGPSTWSTESLMTAAQVNAGLLSNASLPTVAWVLGCYGTYFTSPDYNAIGPALMVQSNGGGAAAVLGASTLTEVNSDIAWMRAMKPLIGTQRIGDALRTGQNALHAAGPVFLDVSLGGELLGDPTLRVRQ